MKKKYLLPIFLSILCLLFLPKMAYAASLEYVACHDPNILKGLRIIAYLIMVIKILVPIVLVVTGMYSFFKATIDSDDSATKNAVNLFIKKLITGAVIFFIPTIVTACFNIISGYDKTKLKFTECGKCITSVKECNTLIKRYK